MARVKSDEYEYRNGERVWIGPKYPVALGADVQDWRRAARVEKLSRDDMRRYGAAVHEAFRELQRRELLAAWPRMPSLKRPPIYRTPSSLKFAYSRPNPFRMVDDPAEWTEYHLYANRLGITRTEAEIRADAQQAILDGVTPAST